MPNKAEQRIKELQLKMHSTEQDCNCLNCIHGDIEIQGILLGMEAMKEEMTHSQNKSD